jgi:hypothetical protein
MRKRELRGSMRGLMCRLRDGSELKWEKIGSVLRLGGRCK